jgi:NADH-quinone oxidoreductase subunit N
MDFAIYWKNLSPEIIMAATALLVVLADLLVSRKGWLAVISLIGIACALVLNAGFIANPHMPTSPTINALFINDSFAAFMSLIFLGLAALIIMASTDYMCRLKNYHGEFYALVLLSTLGMMLLVSATNLITIFVSLELATIPLYALVGLLKDQRGTEASLKYLLLGAIASAVLLYGLALIFGFTGKTSLSSIVVSLLSMSPADIWAAPGLLMGLALTVAAFGFKAAAVPFHMWAPDVYEGSPTPVTLLLSAGSKLAGLAVLMRLLAVSSSQLSDFWSITIAVMAALGMTLGNLLAIPQGNIKRMLAYSGIAQSGFMLMAVSIAIFSHDIPSLSTLLFYMLAFALAEVAAFTVVTVASQHLSDDIAAYSGLGRRSPWLAAAMTLGLISLTGLPPAAGFIAKFYLFSHALDAGLMWLLIIAVLNAVISAYFFLRVVRLLWLVDAQDSTPVTASLPPKLVLLIVSLGILALGVMPIWGMKLAEYGAFSILP